MSLQLEQFGYEENLTIKHFVRQTPEPSQETEVLEERKALLKIIFLQDHSESTPSQLIPLEHVGSQHLTLS